ncbi:hypothetical protein [Demequina lignilytica]|uniref:Membrane domain of glycerophosphoryl diester phosphodiesterase n=1 Tax=Demequina lignilytica TaxID=3051663 RepID=A0AB35MFX1_9MICO|nr:hypothetical protein [Demequina sp. SYSU T0a273]MDN4482647.1 hypothetical protein [Demequina sp. SYSU T0a273]
MTDQQGTSGWAAPGGAPTPAGPPVGPPAAASYPPPYVPPAVPPSAAPPAPGIVPPPHAAPAPAPTYRSWQPGIMPLRPLSFGDFLSVPFKAMRFNRGVVLGGPLLLTLVATLATAAFMWLLFTDPSLAILDPTSDLGGIEPSTVLVGGIAVIAMLLADLLSSAVVAPAVARAVLGERIRLSQAFAAVRERLGSLLLLYLMTAGAGALVLGIALVPMLMAGASDDSLGLGVGLTLLLWVAVIPVAFLIGLFSGLARPVIVLEKRGPIDAVRRVLRLIKGRFWWTVLILFVSSLIVSMVAGVFQQIGSIGALVVGIAAPDNLTLIAIGAVLAVSVGMVVSYVLTYSYLGSLLTLLHIDLRIRHEGFDLTLAEAAEASRRA